MLFNSLKCKQNRAGACRSLQGVEFLTISEAADYVRLGERKLYELVTEGAIPGSKVTGKWLFPRHELDLWVLSGLARPAGMVAPALSAAARTICWNGACANPAQALRR